MMLIRRFEEKAAKMYARNRIAGFLHLYIGQEAVAVGAMACGLALASKHLGNGRIVLCFFGDGGDHGGTDRRPMLPCFSGRLSAISTASRQMLFSVRPQVAA